MHFRSFLKSSAAVACIMPVTALADVSAQEVWQDWQGLYESYGYAVTADESTSAGALTLSNIVMQSILPDDGGEISVRIPTMVMNERGDGTVSVAIPDAITATFEISDDAMDDVSGEIDYLMTGLEMIVSGTPGALDYNLTASRAAINLTSLVVDGQPQAITAASLIAEEFALRTTSTIEGELRRSEQDGSALQVSYNIDMNDPQNPEVSFLLAGSMARPSISGWLTAKQGLMDMEDMAKVMADGFAVVSNLRHEGASVNLVVEGRDAMTMQSASGAGTLDFTLSSEGMGYAASATGVSTTVIMQELPLPVELRMAEIGANFLFPISAGAAPQDFTLGLTLRDLILPDLLWGMFDPAGQLPRDPATLVLDLAGQATLDKDMMSPDFAQQLDMPMRAENLTVRDITLRLAGAELTAQGAFQFDNDAMGAMPGMPNAAGGLDMKLVGGNQLLTTLTAMGLLPQEQAMAAQMMMGLFAVPAGDDTLTTRIEITEDGQILANGQRIQ